MANHGIKSGMTDTAEKPVSLGKYLGVNEVCDQLGVSRSTLTRERSDGKFPPHRKIRGRKVWLATEVRDYIESRSVTHAVTHNGKPTRLAPFTPSSDTHVMTIGIEGNADEVADGLEWWLQLKGIRGCTVSSSGGVVMVSWPVNLGVEPEAVEAAVASLWTEVEPG